MSNTSTNLKQLVILYPEKFTCQSKFNRKVGKITERMGRFDVLRFNDHHNFTSQYFSEDSRVDLVSDIDSLDVSGITHAIVFDDGEEFASDREKLVLEKVVLRWVKIPITRVVNIKREAGYKCQADSSIYEYVGRGSYWGNPYPMNEEGVVREEVIRRYKYDFDHDKFPNKDTSEVLKLAGKRLGCYCTPAPCHGDVLAEYLNGYDDEA